MGNLVGSGAPGAVLTAVAGLNNYVLRVEATNVGISGVTINGNSANQIHGGDTSPWNFHVISCWGVFIFVVKIAWLNTLQF